MQIAPAIAAVKLAFATIEPLRTKPFVETIGWVTRIPEQQHRADAPLEEPAGDMLDELASDSVSVPRSQHIDFVQLTLKPRNTAVVNGTLREANQATVGSFGDIAEPVPLALERFAPLTFAYLERRGSQSTVCLSERRNMK